MDTIQITKPNLKVHADAILPAPSEQAARRAPIQLSPPQPGTLSEVLLGLTLNMPAALNR